MAEYYILSVKKVLEVCVDVAVTEKDKLTEIDSNTGDGDMGVSMEKGALALRETIGKWQGDVIGPMLMNAGMAFNKAAPSTMGTLISMGLMSLGKEWKEKTVLEDGDIVGAPRILLETIAKQGKANRGDKTVLDALYPLAEKLEASYAESSNLTESLKKAAEAAIKGMEATKGMQAKAGRARWLGERAAEYPDGGAFLCARIAARLTGV